jgi:hypothetical protein
VDFFVISPKMKVVKNNTHTDVLNLIE